jgi:hypothetical protein
MKPDPRREGTANYFIDFGQAIGLNHLLAENTSMEIYPAYPLFFQRVENDPDDVIIISSAIAIF